MRLLILLLTLLITSCNQKEIDEFVNLIENETMPLTEQPKILDTIIDIGEWNMQADSFVDVPHTLDKSKVLYAIVSIYDDGGDLHMFTNKNFAEISPGPDGIIEIRNSTIRLERGDSGFFTGTLFNDTLPTRGRIIVYYLSS